MTLFEAYKKGLNQLKNPEIDEINLRILLCENNSLKSMTDFYIHKDENIKDLQRFNEDLQRFLRGEPVQYITGKASFLGHDFKVNSNVLIPRNETEEVVLFAARKIKDKFDEKSIQIADVCTGSGCIGCELFNRTNCDKVLFSDISEKAIEIAQENAKTYKVNGEFYVSDALSYLENKVDVVVANPPYILNKENIDKSVDDYEPHLALYVDEQLSIYHKIIEKACALGIELMVFEIGFDLEEKLTKLIKNLAPNYSYGFEKDMNGKLRICWLEKTN